VHFRGSEITNCSWVLEKSLPIIKSVYENNEFDSLNAFLDVWKHTCIDYSDINKLKMLINIKLNKPFDKQFDSAFISILRFQICNILDLDYQYYGKISEFYYDHNGSAFSSWIKEQANILAAKIDTSDSNLPLLLYLSGDTSNSFKKAIFDTNYQRTTFSKIVKREFNQLKGIKIIVPDQYQTIDQAISVCKDRDTIFIKNGRYKISSIIKKQIFIIGENKYNTVITGKFNQPCLTIGMYVVVKNIRFEFSKSAILNYGHGEISNCIFEKNWEGIVSTRHLPKISNCIFINNWRAISLQDARSDKNTISNNIFDNNRIAIYFIGFTGTLIQFNIYYKNNTDVRFYSTANEKGIYLHSNNFFGSRKKSNSKITRENNSLNIEPIFANPGNPQYNYSLVPSSPFKGSNNDNEIIGIYEN
jgi:hypothetical protein